MRVRPCFLHRDRILIIKPGAGGLICGYNNKYLDLARRLQRECGFSVMCCSPSEGTAEQKDFDLSVAQSEFGGLDGKDICCFGMSRGAS